MNVPQEVSFLVVDDDTISVMAMKRALRKLGLTNEVCVASNGIEALAFLDEASSTSGDSPPPFIVTLDYNMPRMNGPEFVDALHSRPALRLLPVLMFMSSHGPRDATPPCVGRVSGYLLKDDLQATLSTALQRL